MSRFILHESIILIPFYGFAVMIYSQIFRGFIQRLQKKEILYLLLATSTYLLATYILLAISRSVMIFIFLDKLTI